MRGRAQVGAIVIVFGCSMGGSLASATPPECLEAVFFDLGDTLVESAGGGMFTLRAGALDTIDALQDAGIELGIITNVPAGWTRANLEAILLEPWILDEFEVLVLSSEAPAPKPNPAIYTFAHGLLPTAIPIGASAFVGETLSEIGNHATAPTLGARAAGMVGIHLSDLPPSVFADFTIPTDGLLDVVGIVAPGCLFRDGFETGDPTRWSAIAP